MKQRIVIDVIYTKYIEVELPEDADSTEVDDILTAAAKAEVEALPDEINGFLYDWDQYEEA